MIEWMRRNAEEMRGTYYEDLEKELRSAGYYVQIEDYSTYYRKLRKEAWQYVIAWLSVTIVIVVALIVSLLVPLGAFA